MLLHTQTVSRKTPNDGLLEITGDAADRLAALASEFPVATNFDEAPGSIRTLTCTCGKGGEGTHVHYFLESPVLRALTPGEEVAVELDDRGAVRISPT